jgi:hypothetical protein
MVTTRAHENHDTFVLPLLVMALQRSRLLWIIYGLISLTLLLNMAMHDFGLEAWRQSVMAPDAWRRLQLANAAVNVLVLARWSVRMWPGPLRPRQTRPVASPA